MTGTTRIKRIFGLFAAMVSVVMLAAPGTAMAQDEKSNDDYLVKPGDTLLISVWKEEDLRQEVLIAPDGGFSFPLAGNLSAAGKSVSTISREVSIRLQRYIPDLVVTVMITAINGNKIYVIGQVNNPGTFVMNPQIDVMQALSMAGGTNAYASLNDIKIIRRTASGQRVLRFRYNDVARGRDLSQNIMLESGDVVVVP